MVRIVADSKYLVDIPQICELKRSVAERYYPTSPIVSIALYDDENKDESTDDFIVESIIMDTDPVTSF